MSEALRILILEDRPTDAELMLREVRKEGIEFAALRVDTEEEFRTQLQEYRPALILADYRLPTYDGLSALAVAQEECPDVPFIFVSGSLGEDTAVESLHHGATDYILKERLSRLGAAVRRALLEVEERKDLKRAEQRLRDSEMRYRGLFESAKDGVLIIDAEAGTVVDVNPFLTELLGVSHEQCIGKKVWELGFFKGVVANRGNFAEVQQKEDLRYEDMALETSDGRHIDVEFVSNVCLVNDRKVIQCNIRDITERKRAESTLRLQSAALNATAVPIVITDCNGTIEWINPAFTCLTGYNALETIGRNPRELVKSGVHDEAFYKNVWETILAGHVWRGEMTNRRKDGSLYPEIQTITPVKDARGEITHFVAIKRDLTEQRQAEAQFLQAQKMETVGQLAGGIAHDFNNLLTIINATAELAVMDLREDDPLRADFDEIRRAGDRAAALTRQLLAFSRKQIMKPEAVNLSTLVVNMQAMLQRLIGEHLKLVVRPAEHLGSVLADPGQIEQVVMNLAVNARDAMPDGGTLTIATRDVVLDAAYAATHPSVQPGPHVMLAISDTGAGMDAATQKRIFEPFFTTKERGKGTGLGLSTVYGIVKQSRGSIWVHSEPGRGTAFEVYLPRTDAVALPERAAPVVTPVHGVETILIVEDEAAVCHLAERVLRTAGYAVLTASNGPEALAALERHVGPVDLVLTDMVMPGMSGRDLVARIAEFSPRMKVLYTSGYIDEAILYTALFDKATHFIGKPYAAADLTRKVREVLDAS